MSTPTTNRSREIRYDLEALASEAIEDKTGDESAKVRVTQTDIQKLLQKRMKGRK